MNEDDHKPSAKETIKRRDDALRRALNTPPKPKIKPKDGESRDEKRKPAK